MSTAVVSVRLSLALYLCLYPRWYYMKINMSLSRVGVAWKKILKDVNSETWQKRRPCECWKWSWHHAHALYTSMAWISVNFTTMWWKSLETNTIISQILLRCIPPEWFKSWIQLWQNPINLTGQLAILFRYIQNTLAIVNFPKSNILH